MITKTLKQLVKKEAKALLTHATKEERESLDFNNLDPDHKSRCIYGQMTGRCTSKRASQLIRKSCEKVYRFGEAGPIDEDAVLSGKPRKNRNDNLHSWLPEPLEYFSPIEVYILNPGAKNKELIEYLRGERKTLDL